MVDSCDRVFAKKDSVMLADGSLRRVLRFLRRPRFRPTFFFPLLRLPLPFLRDRFDLFFPFLRAPAADDSEATDDDREATEVTRSSLWSSASTCCIGKRRIQLRPASRDPDSPVTPPGVATDTRVIKMPRQPRTPRRT